MDNASLKGGSSPQIWLKKNTYYCSPVRRGFTDSQEGIVRKWVRLSYLSLSAPTFEILCNKAGCNLLACIFNYSCHVLHKLLPPVRITRYSILFAPDLITESSMCLTICLRNVS